LLKSGANRATNNERIELLADGKERALTNYEICKMTLRIEKSTDGGNTFLRLIGRVQREHLEELGAQISAIKERIVIDMEGVTLVDAETVRFLGDIETQGIEFLHCSPYIREWIRRENEETRS
jgi:hypothetical protein